MIRPYFSQNEDLFIIHFDIDYHQRKKLARNGSMFAWKCGKTSLNAKIRLLVGPDDYIQEDSDENLQY